MPSKGIARRGIDVAGSDARLHRRNRGILRFQHRVVDPQPSRHPAPPAPPCGSGRRSIRRRPRQSPAPEVAIPASPARPACACGSAAFGPLATIVSNEHRSKPADLMRQSIVAANVLLRQPRLHVAKDVERDSREQLPAPPQHFDLVRVLDESEALDDAFGRHQRDPGRAGKGIGRVFRPVAPEKSRLDGGAEAAGQLARAVDRTRSSPRCQGALAGVF